MMNFTSGWEGYVFLLVAGFLATEPWRWLGVYLSSGIDEDSEVLHWVRAVSTALVAGLVARLVLFPVGALAEVGLWLRVAAFGAGLVVYLFMGRVLFVGICASIVVLMVGQLM